MGSETEYDVIVVGAGHNGLVCACYLARAGLKVLVLERRGMVGGAVITETDIFEGYRIDTCSAYHVSIHGTPIVEDLELSRFGLEYLDIDPWAFAPFPNGRHIFFYRDVDRTAQSIAAFSVKDAEAYRAFMGRWMPLNQAISATFCRPPDVRSMTGALMSQGAGMLGAGLRRPGQVRRWLAGLTGGGLSGGAASELLHDIFSPYGQLLEHTFETPEVRAALAWLGAQSGPGPDDGAGGELLAFQQSVYHLNGVKRPRGGSGMLTQALARCLEHHGGRVEVNAPVTSILVQGGRVRGVRLASGEALSAPKVVAATQVQTSLLELLPAGVLSERLQRRVQSIRVVNGFGMTVRCAVEALPSYAALPTRGAAGQPVAGLPHIGMQLLCPSETYLRRTYAEAGAGMPPSQPAVIAMTPSAVDDSLAPPGRHVLYIWAQTHPFRLSTGERWKDIREREAEKCLQVVEAHAPGFRAGVLGMYIKSPEDLEEINGLRRGHLMHVDMSLGQMFMFRPLPELSGYVTPVPGLYLTGASTHPGGSVSGASGYNAARVLLNEGRWAGPR